MSKWNGYVKVTPEVTNWVNVLFQNKHECLNGGDWIKEPSRYLEDPCGCDQND